MIAGGVRHDRVLCCAAGLDIGSHVCGDEAEEPTITNIDTQIAMVARAFAEAIAEVSATCTTRGSARVRGRAMAQAEARAAAYGEAISRIYADSEVCGKCTAAVDAIARTSRELVAEATAQAWVEVRPRYIRYRQYWPALSLSAHLSTASSTGPEAEACGLW